MLESLTTDNNSDAISMQAMIDHVLHIITWGALAIIDLRLNGCLCLYLVGVHLQLANTRGTGSLGHNVHRMHHLPSPLFKDKM